MRAVAEKRIREGVETTTMKNGAFEGSVTVSIGVTTLGEGSEVGDTEALLKLVDEAVYRAKKEGRNRWSEGHPPDRKKTA